MKINSISDLALSKIKPKMTISLGAEAMYLSYLKRLHSIT